MSTVETQNSGKEVDKVNFGLEVMAKYNCSNPKLKQKTCRDKNVLRTA